MPIRREDKEFIQAMSLLGAVFGACIGLIIVMHFSDRAHESFAEQSSYVQTQAALLKLQTTVVNPNNPIADETVLNQVQKQMDQTPTPAEPVVEKNFLVRMSRLGYLALCTGGCVVGAIAGYSSVWLAGWVGSILVLYCIRMLYLMIRTVSPSLAVGKGRAGSGQKPDAARSQQRDEGRILPVLVKLCFLVLVILSVLAAVVWKLTEI